MSMKSQQMDVPVSPIELASANRSDLENLQAQRAALEVRFNKGCDYLTALAERVGQDSPEYDRYFAEWEKLNEEYKRLCDRIDILELKAKLTGPSASCDEAASISA